MTITDHLTAGAVLAAAGYAVTRLVRDGRRRARAAKPRVLSWHEALAVVGDRRGRVW